MYTLPTSLKLLFVNYTAGKSYVLKLCLVRQQVREAEGTGTVRL